MTYIASVDVGTTNIKINLFTDTYDVIDAVKYPHTKIYRTDEKFELDLDEIWGHLMAGLSSLITRNKVEQLEVVLTTAMHSVQLLKDDYSLKGSLITWADKRGSREIQERSLESLEQQYYRTGTPIHSMNPYFKLLACGEDDLSGGALVGSLKDVLFYRLTGEWVIDLSNASSGGLLNLATLAWDSQSLDDIGLIEAQLPVIQPISYRASALEAHFEIEVGVVLGTSDGISSNYTFADLENVAVLSIGTSHAVRVIDAKPQLNAAYQNFAYAINADRYLIGLPSNNGADVLAWANSVFNSSYAELNEVAMMRPETQSVFIPHLNGERAPVWNEFATGNLLKLSRVSTRESVLFSVILGMIFNIKHNVDQLAELVEFEAIGLVGGLTELAAFPQLIADILGYTLYIPLIKNAETLGSIAAVKGKTFELEYQVVEPAEDAGYGELFKEYLELVSRA